MVSRLPRSGIDLSPLLNIAEKMRFPLLLQQVLQKGLVAKELRVGKGFVGRVV